MPSTAAPYGLIPMGMAGGVPKGVANGYILTTNTATGFFEGDIVNMGAGVLTPVAATPTTTRNGNTPWGIFAGCSYYTGPSGQGFVNSNTFPAAGYTAYSSYGPITLYIYDDPYMEMKVQSSATVAATALGKKAALGNFGGSTTTGKSTVYLDASTINTTNTLAVTIKRFSPDSVSGTGTPAATYVDLIVVWNQNVHALTNILGV